MKKILVLVTIALIIIPLSFLGCKAKTQNTPEQAMTETTAMTPSQEEAMQTQPIEPAQNVASEPIPPTAAPGAPAKVSAIPQDILSRNKDIQLALQKAGFYAGSIDGKLGPMTKKGIEDFQKAKGLKVDGKVGPRTWVELVKYLSQ